MCKLTLRRGMLAALGGLSTALPFVCICNVFELIHSEPHACSCFKMCAPHIVRHTYIYASLSVRCRWGYTSADGRSLRSALDFVLPYALCERAWPYQEETPFDHGKLFEILRIASRKWKNASYEQAIPRLACAPGLAVDYGGAVENLLWPRMFHSLSLGLDE
jgi:hypothetical protein